MYRSLDEKQLSFVRATRQYLPDSVGQIMSHDPVVVREERGVGEAVAELRAAGDLPRLADALFVVDARNVVRGVLPLKALLLRSPEARIAELIGAEFVAFGPDDPAGAAARAFERYDLLSTPVVDERGKLLGRVTVDAVMDFVRQQADIKELQRAGLAGEEDLFAPVWLSARNRWLWLAVNLVTAFLASRVIGLSKAPSSGSSPWPRSCRSSPASAVPLLLHRTGRDPAQGASVLLTFTTDGMGFFLFLAVARAFLI